MAGKFIASRNDQSVGFAENKKTKFWQLFTFWSDQIHLHFSSSALTNYAATNLYAPKPELFPVQRTWLT